jgi:hypothetical protein
MKVNISLTIAIAGLTVKEISQSDPTFQMGDFNLDLKHEVDMQPEEYTTAVNSIGKMLTTCIYDLAKPSHMVDKEPPIKEDAFMCRICHKVPAAPFSTICTDCQKGG